MSLKMEINIPFKSQKIIKQGMFHFVSVSFKSSEVTTFGGKGPMPLYKTECTALADLFDTLPSTLMLGDSMGSGVQRVPAGNL